MQKQSLHFPNLDGIRFIAASMVLLHHIEQIRYMLGLSNYWGLAPIRIMGKLGVVAFFVLSGFLISYKLFVEKQQSRSINIKDFYLRRVKRIWPLYFLVIILGFFILPFIPYFTLPGLERSVVWSDLAGKLSLYLFFLPNLVLHVYGVVPYVAQLWSIGAEEQFYLVWPVLNKYIRWRWLLMIGVVVGYLAIAAVLPLVSPVLAAFWHDAPFSCMAIGGMYAIVAYDKSEWMMRRKEQLFAPVLQWMVLVLVVALAVVGVTFPVLHYELYSVLFGYLILNFASNNKPIINLEFEPLKYLGKISYGIYMFHPIVIVGVLKYNSGVFSYPVILLATVGVAALSYEFFEKRFLRRKPARPADPANIALA